MSDQHTALLNFFDNLRNILVGADKFKAGGKKFSKEALLAYEQLAQGVYLGLNIMRPKIEKVNFMATEVLLRRFSSILDTCEPSNSPAQEVQALSKLQRDIFEIAKFFYKIKQTPDTELPNDVLIVMAQMCDCYRKYYTETNKFPDPRIAEEQTTGRIMSEFLPKNKGQRQ